MLYRYRYSSNEEWTEIEADRYEQSNTEGYCSDIEKYRIRTKHQVQYYCIYWIDESRRRTGKYYLGTEEYQVAFAYTLSDRTEQPEEFFLNFNSIYNRDLNTRITQEYGVRVRLEDGGVRGASAVEGRIKDTNSPPHPGCNSGDFKGAYVLADTIEILSVTDWDDETRSLCDNCEVKFYKDGLVIRTLSRNSCPEIEEVTEECPEGTCKVICGNVACCYGSDGVAVSSFNL